jgi:hypothetical protein
MLGLGKSVFAVGLAAQFCSIFQFAFSIIFIGVFRIFKNKVSDHFQKSICLNNANSSEVVTTCKEMIINGAKVRLLWGVHPMRKFQLIAYLRLIVNTFPSCPAGPVQIFRRIFRIHSLLPSLHHESSRT